MALAVGTQLGSLEVTALIGRGGMGEVYRARDTKLKRDVAVKILPNEFSRDADRVSRFQREAEVLASLNHPNIGAIYDLQEANGSRYLVLELVEGDTLAERIASGPIPIEDALDIAKNICEALEAAHEKGIIHRDLKPANVKITPDGKVKVLDFGLAKAMSGTATETTLSNSPTLLSGSMGGAIIGTAAYMSPEQARGRTADQRSDVFAFGCVLYEMLTGRQAFQGEDVSDVLAAVLRAEPDLNLLPTKLNPRLPELLRRCLAKNRRDRWQAAGDLRVELESIAAAPYAAPSTTQPIIRSQPLWKRAIPVLIAAIVFAAIGSVVTRTLNRPTPGTVARFPLVLPEGQGFTHTTRHVLAISPDGTRLAYIANNQLFLRNMAEMEARPIAGSSGRVIGDPVFSPDGQWIAYWSGDGTLKKIAITGGAALTICRADDPTGLSWDRDQIVFGQLSKGIFRVFSNGGTPEMLVELKGNPLKFADSPQVLNGGRDLLFTLTTETSGDRWDKAQIVVQSLSSGQWKVVLQGGSAARYVSTGHLVYVLGTTVLAVPFNARNLEMNGAPVPVLEGVTRGTTPDSSGYANFAISESGSLVYVPGTASGVGGQQTLALVDRQGKVQPLDLPPQQYVHPRVSPDGKQIGLVTGGEKEAIIWIYDLKGGSPLRRLTFGGSNRFPIWTPDSRYITFQSDRDGDAAMFRQAADGSGPAERLTKPDQGARHEPESWSPDGRTLSFNNLARGDEGIWTVTPGADAKAKVFFDLPNSTQKQSVFSPDGRWVAYMSSQEITGGTEVFVQPFPPTGAKYQISTEGGRTPLWSPDGKQLFYHQANTDRLLAVDVRTQPAFSFGKPTPFPIEGTVHPLAQRNYDITPDGKQFLVVLPSSATRADPARRSNAQINVVLNWLEELKQRVPVH